MSSVLTSRGASFAASHATSQVASHVTPGTAPGTMQGAEPAPPSRFLSAEECQQLLKRATHMAVGGGDTVLHIESGWTGNLRWARNLITTSGDVRDNSLFVGRSMRGAHGTIVTCNQIDDVGLEAAIRRSERMIQLHEETGGVQFEEHFSRPSDEVMATMDAESWRAHEAMEAGLASLVQTPEEYAKPHLFFDATYNLDAAKRAAGLDSFVRDAKAAGMLSAGYIEVSALGRAVADTYGRALYFPYTVAQYSVTVRSPDDGASGWAGVDWNDWNRIDTTKLSAIALDKCLKSRNAVAVEPGRYTTILEPQAVGDMFKYVIGAMDRQVAESGSGPFSEPGPEHRSKIGRQIFDPRITMSADPMDPDLGFPPFDSSGNAYHAATWVKNGVLVDLPYYRPYAIRVLGKNTGLPSSKACRMNGGTTTLDEMIATTTRGVLVTRFSDVGVLDPRSLLMTGYTRDGFWLIERGKISKPIKNMRFVDSPMFVFNALEQLGAAQRIFHPDAPMIMPLAKVRDFNFTSLSSAV